MDKCYRPLTLIAAPFLPLWLHWRRRKGKEDAQRIRERFGHASQPRPAGQLLWIHAASVGEAMSVLLLMELLRQRFPALNVLLTTGTVTSARLMEQRLPEGVIHQYAPVDTPDATSRFIRHWLPDVALWVESEFWPNLVDAATEAHCYMGVINARMSEGSFTFWRRHPAMVGRMLAVFDFFFAQTPQDAARLKELGATTIHGIGNMKYDAALLPCDERELIRLKLSLANRTLWLAASTHPGEEELVARVHDALKQRHANLLTIIVPRHPPRGEKIASLLAKAHAVARRGKAEPITEATQFYVADTLGELGLFYQLCETVFMGGSLVEHGGQNPLEPGRLSCAVITGPHTHNFAAIYGEMENAGACAIAQDADDLAAQLAAILGNARHMHAMQTRARQWVESKNGATEQLLAQISPLFQPTGR